MNGNVKYEHMKIERIFLDIHHMICQTRANQGHGGHIVESARNGLTTRFRQQGPLGQASF